jgi:hypothetical protein
LTEIEEILELPRQQRTVNAKLHRQAVDRRRTVEMAEETAHRQKRAMAPTQLKPICSDNALAYTPRNALPAARIK